MSKKTKIVYPIKKDWSNLSEAFNRGAKGNRRDMKEAVMVIKKFDNRFGTDFIGMIAHDVGVKPKDIREGRFTKSLHTIDSAQESFFRLSKAFPQKAAAKLARDSKPTQTKPERNIIRPNFGSGPSARVA